MYLVVKGPLINPHDCDFFITHSSTGTLGNKGYASLWCNPNKKFHCGVMLIVTPYLSTCEKVTGSFHKYFSTVNYYAAFLKKPKGIVKRSISLSGHLIRKLVLAAAISKIQIPRHSRSMHSKSVGYVFIKFNRSFIKKKKSMSVLEVCNCDPIKKALPNQQKH